MDVLNILVYVYTYIQLLMYRLYNTFAWRKYITSTSFRIIDKTLYMSTDHNHIHCHYSDISSYNKITYDETAGTIQINDGYLLYNKYGKQIHIHDNIVHYLLISYMYNHNVYRCLYDINMCIQNVGNMVVEFYPIITNINVHMVIRMNPFFKCCDDGDCDYEHRNNRYLQQISGMYGDFHTDRKYTCVNRIIMDQYLCNADQMYDTSSIQCENELGTKYVITDTSIRVFDKSQTSSINSIDDIDKLFNDDIDD